MSKFPCVVVLPALMSGHLLRASDLDLQQMIVDAAANGRHKVTLPAGRFHLASDAVRLRNLHDFTIEGAGPERTILVTDMWASTAVVVSESQRITLRGFALDREPVPFVQATITNVSEKDPASVILEFAVHDGYPKLTPRVLSGLKGCGQFFGKNTRKLKQPDRWFAPQAGKNVHRVDDTHGRIVLPGDWKSRIVAGDYVVMTSGNGAAFVLLNSDSIRLEDVAILASGSLGVGARFLTGENFFRYTIKPGPTPTGATEPRLLSTNADGMQYFWSPGAVTFDHCDFSFTGDDGINLSIPQAPRVVEAETPTRLRASSRMEGSYAKQMVAIARAGHIVRPERIGTFEPLGDMPLQSVSYLGSHKDADGRELSDFLVELKEPPPQKVAPGDVLVFRQMLPERFAIRNSSFRETRARGLLIMASNGVIENNLIERTALAGIYFLQELAGSGGADWVSNVLVRHNTIRDVCFNDSDRITAVAALQVLNRPALFPSASSPFIPWLAAHHDIRIIDNTIEGSDAAGILINGLDGGEVRGNIVRDTNRARGKDTVDFSAGVPMTVPYAITVMNSRDVRVTGNKVTGLGIHTKAAVRDVGTFPAAEAMPVQRP
jgi:parallel beta-helix repeat protein